MAQASMELSDGCRFEVSDIRQWLGRRTLDSHPLVFLNSCQGGQMESLFYHSFAAELLVRKATCVVGAQIDVPLALAPEYARRFFARFLKGYEHVGAIVRDLAAEFLNRYHNPLGLIFSSYRGLDTYFEAPPR